MMKCISGVTLLFLRGDWRRRSVKSGRTRPSAASIWMEGRRLRKQGRCRTERELTHLVSWCVSQHPDKLQHCHEYGHQQTAHQHHEDAADVLHTQTCRVRDDRWGGLVWSWVTAGNLMKEKGQESLINHGPVYDPQELEQSWIIRTWRGQTFGSVVLFFGTLSTIPPLPLQYLQTVVLLQLQDGQVKFITVNWPWWEEKVRAHR